MNTRLLGAKGEYFASRYLRDKGYDILSGNFVGGTGEIDIVATDNNFICFVEVKTRTRGTMFAPAEAVDHRKQENIRSAAAVYMKDFPAGVRMRYDIIEVLVDENAQLLEINHIKNAF